MPARQVPNCSLKTKDLRNGVTVFSPDRRVGRQILARNEKIVGHQDALENQLIPPNHEEGPISPVI
jgi:hypothetical protein